MSELKEIQQLLKEKLSKKLKTTAPVRLIVISFLLVIVVGSLLLMLPISVKAGQPPTQPIDALFTATSATCVTGLAIYDTYTHWTVFGQIVILVLIQIGGLGFSTFAIGFTLLVRKKLGIREMVIAGETSGGSMPNMKSLIRLMLGFTFICELTGALLLMLRFVPMFGAGGIWPSIFIGISAYCNAGFDVIGFLGQSSMSYFAGDPLVSLTISGLIIIGGLGFIVVQDIYQCKIATLRRHQDSVRLNFHTQICLRVTVILLLVGTATFLLFEYNNTMGHLNFFEKLNASFFQSTNTRTAGFASVDIGKQTEFTKIISVLLMFIGGCPGSTAGGIKVTTLVVLLATVMATIRGRGDPNMLKHRFATGAVYRALTVIFLAFCLIFLDAGIIAWMNPGVPVLDAVFEATSAFGTVGLTANLTPHLDPLSKFMLSFTMFIGRVGPLSFGLSIMMRHKDKSDSILPEGRMLIG